MTLTHRELFERYVYAGAIGRDPEAIAALFTDDGEYEAPLVPEGHPLPRRRRRSDSPAVPSRTARRAGPDRATEGPATAGSAARAQRGTV